MKFMAVLITLLLISKKESLLRKKRDNTLADINVRIGEKNNDTTVGRVREGYIGTN